jgi:hypothetical protein
MALGAKRVSQKVKLNLTQRSIPGTTPNEAALWSAITTEGMCSGYFKVE